VSINGGVDPKRCDRDIEDINDVSASLADVRQRPTKSRRLDANAPISSMCVAYPVLLECGPCRRQIGRSWRPTAVYVATAGARPGQSAFWTAAISHADEIEDRRRRPTSGVKAFLTKCPT